jgi:hypothetical protein
VGRKLPALFYFAAELRRLENPGGETMSKMAEILTASEAARILGCSAESVRRFERIGVLPANKTPRGTRIFRTVDVVKFAKKREGEKLNE